MDNKIFEMSDEDFTSLIRSSRNKAEVLFKLGYSVEGNSWGYALLKKRMEELGLNGLEFKGRVDSFKCTSEETLKQEDIFVENSEHNRSVARKYILKHKLLPYKCAICGISEWQGKELSLQLDHINGVNNDHRLENLRFLCPNCHSLTETYGSKNSEYSEKRKVYAEGDLKEQIIEAYKRLGSREKVRKELGITDSVIKNTIEKAGIDYNSVNQCYVIRYDLNNNEIARFGSITEACQYVIDHNEVKTKLVKTCRATFNRNKGKVWLGSKWRVFNAQTNEEILK